MPRVQSCIAVLVGGLALAAPAHARVELAQVATLTRPLALTAPPDDTSRVYVAQQTGQVRVVRDGQALATPYLDLAQMGLVTAISDDPGDYSERGLLGLAFSPDHAQTGRFYVLYTRRDSGDVQIDEFRRGASPDVADPGTRRSVLRIPHGQQGNHNGGQLAFGPDGMLYAGVGDGGGTGDPADNGQNLSSADPAVVSGTDHHPLLGKILRIDPRSADPYAIPPGGPALGGRPEIWSLGLRNPFRFSFDRGTGDLVVGDVGQNSYEEIDWLPAAGGGGGGANLGWDNREGLHAFPGGSALATQPRTDPVIEHAHSDGWCSIAGGHVVRDPALPDLLGQYVYGDYCKGEVWAARLATPATDVRSLGFAQIAQLSSLGEDACARVYVLSLEGPVYRLSDSGACTPAGGGGAGGGGGGTTPGTDTTAPVLTLRARSKRVARSGRVRVRARCDETCTVRAAATFLVRSRRARAAVVLRSATLRRTLAGGSTVALDLRVSRTTRRALGRLLRRNRVVRARIEVVATDGSGNRTRRVARVAVRRG